MDVKWQPRGDKPSGRAAPMTAPYWLVPPSCGLWYSREAFMSSFVPKNQNLFWDNWTSFGTVNLKSKKHAENNNWDLAVGQKFTAKK